MTRSAISSCRKRTRSAEQRWPALSKAELITSATSCSGSADESAISAFCPPVSAMSGMMRPPARGERAAIARAVSVEPVKATPATRGSATSRAPTVAPSPGRRWSTSPGMPASCSSRTAAAATSGVCSAGLATTALPAASAAATWPKKIASGKFHGEMQAKTPRPWKRSVLRSPVGPGSAGGARNRRGRARRNSGRWSIASRSSASASGRVRPPSRR